MNFKFLWHSENFFSMLFRMLFHFVEQLGNMLFPILPNIVLVIFCQRDFDLHCRKSSFNTHLVIWSSGFCMICQAITIWFPGKNPMMYYFCLGKMPKNLIQETFKKNSSFDFIVIYSIVNHAFIGVKFWIFKKEDKQRDQPVKSFTIGNWGKESLYR